MGAARVIAIDHYPRRLELARRLGAEVIDYTQTSVLEALMEMSGGIGPDAVIDAVGMESHGFAPDSLLDAAKQMVGMGADRAHALREAIMAVRKGGRVSIPGVYGGMADKFPTGALDGERAAGPHRARPTSSAIPRICWPRSRTASSTPPF